MHDASPTEKTESILTKVGRYRLERPLGQGGMGQVFLAKDTLLHRHVAIKRLHGEASQNPAYRKRILDEAQKASRINDPRIASVYDVFEDGNELVLVMEYVEGRTLREHMAGQLSLEEFWEIAEQSLEAFESAHSEGIVHRDIKPDNIMITPEGRIKILDFGLARLYAVEDATTLSTVQSTEHGIRGTPPYLPPEALQGRPVDVRGDVFSLGVTFYEILGGRRPFDGMDRAETYRRILNESPLSLRSINPEIPESLDALIARMLTKDPEFRYPDMSEVRDDLLAARRGDAIPFPAVLPPLPIPAEQKSRRNLRLGVALVGLVLSLSVATWIAWPKLQATDLPEHPNLAVLPPIVNSDDTGFRAFAAGLGEVLSEDLAPTARTKMHLSGVSDALKEKASSPAEAHSYLGADLALQIELSRTDKTMAVKERLIETKTGRVLRAKERDIASATSPLALLELMSADMRKFLNLRREEGRTRKDRFGTEGDGSMQFYLEGRGAQLMATTPQDLDAAQSKLDLALKTDSGFAQARVALGWVFYDYYVRDKNASWLEKMRREGEAAVRLDPQLADAHKLVGMSWYRLGDAEQAQASLERALDLDPTDLITLRQCGRAFGRLGMKKDEENMYRRGVQIMDHDWQSHFWLGTFLYSEGRFDEARQSLEEMVRRAPEYYLGHSTLGAVHVMQGRYPAAVQELERSIALHPTADALSNLGTAYFNLRKMPEAILTYNRSLKFGFGNYILWINLGDAYRWSPDEEAKANEAYREAILLGSQDLEQRPYHHEIKAHLAPIQAWLGEADTARAWIELALQKDAGNPNIDYYAALTYWELQQQDEALEWLEKSVRGGYPRVWIRDSALFDDWRGLPRFQALAEEPQATADTSTFPRRGGT